MATLQQQAERWLSALRMRDTSRRIYATHLRLYVYPTLGDRPFAELRRTDFRALFRALLAEGYAANTIRQTAGIVTTLYADAVEDDIIQDNPVRALTRRIITKKEQGPRPPIVLAIDELRALDMGAQFVDQDTADFTMLLWRTGLRNGEALALRRPLIGLRNRRLLITFTWLDVRLGPTKSGTARWIDVTPAVEAMLRRREAAATSDWLFSRNDGRAWTRTQAARRVTEAARLADLARVTPHHLRHTFATLLKEMGVPVAYIQAQLGHSSIAITNDLYAGSARPPRPAELDRLDSLGIEHRAPLRASLPSAPVGGDITAEAATRRR